MFALLLTCYTLREVLYHCKYFMIKLNEAAEKQTSELIYLLFRMQKVQFVFAQIKMNNLRIKFHNNAVVLFHI